MTDLDGLLAAALAQPTDPTPRLVLADWLDEHGDEADRARAELLRLQVRRERAEADQRDDLDKQARKVLRERPPLKTFLKPILARGRAEALAIGPALVLALCAPLASAVEGPLQAGSTWRGHLHMDDYRFPTTLTLRQRQGNAIAGDMTQDFTALFMEYFGDVVEAGATFFFRGAVVGREWLTFTTHRVEGNGAWPGLYQLRLRPGGWLLGTWWLPDDGRRGELRLRRSRP
jgi:uncharacterized protein (TIGR02996 family)